MLIYSWNKYTFNIAIVINKSYIQLPYIYFNVLSTAFELHLEIFSFDASYKIIVYNKMVLITIEKLQ